MLHLSVCLSFQCFPLEFLLMLTLLGSEVACLLFLSNHLVPEPEGTSAEYIYVCFLLRSSTKAKIILCKIMQMQEILTFHIKIRLSNYS